MAWNEPGGNKPRDPWGGGGGGGDQRPPDLDEALKNLKDRINNLFGGKGGDRGGMLGTMNLHDAVAGQRNGRQQVSVLQRLEPRGSRAQRLPP